MGGDGKKGIEENKREWVTILIFFNFLFYTL